MLGPSHCIIIKRHVTSDCPEIDELNFDPFSYHILTQQFLASIGYLYIY